ncbi:MAG: hypothetical protein CMJ59_08535 [Planctomycetaceae bacterium]|nr:hypothetical protein [Planctomycetaceae bacterium]
MNANQSQRWLRTFLWGCGVVLATVGTGCQSHIGGQILPSPYYHEDDVQYFAPGAEFQLAEEAAALQADKADEQGRSF